jgi:RNA recognition motif-containing protein
MNIFVRNFPFETNEEELRAAFEGFGEVVSVQIIKDRYSHESRGFGFVEMPVHSEASTAISELNGSDFQGRSLSVAEATPRPEHSSGHRARSGRGRRDSRRKGSRRRGGRRNGGRGY